MSGISSLNLCGKNSESQSRRLVFPNHNAYSSKVLVGPWVQERLNAIETPQKPHRLISTTKEDFSEKKSVVDHSIAWDQKIRSENSFFNLIPQTGRYEFPNYFENFSSTYDLSFNHFPKCLKTNLKRKRVRNGDFLPIEEYLQTFGNLTQFGLLEYKKELWDCESQDPRKNLSTHYNETHRAPEIDDYKFKRFAIPLANSTIMDETNRLTTLLNLRDKPSFKVVPSEDLVEVPRPTQWNPITWECIPEKKFLSKKCL